MYNKVWFQYSLSLLAIFFMPAVYVSADVVSGTSPSAVVFALKDHSHPTDWWKLIWAAPGILSLLWNFYQHYQLSKQNTKNRRRDYGLRAFERDVVTPVNDALIEVDKFVGVIEKALKTKNEELRSKELEQHLDDLSVPFLAIRRRVREADQYLAAFGIEPAFESQFFHQDINCEDVIAVNLEKAARTKQIQFVHGHITHMCRELAVAKASVRKILTEKGVEVGRVMESGT